MEKQRLFVDVDGTLAVFRPADTLETLYEEGFFLNSPPVDNVVQAVRRIVKNQPDIEVYILSSVLKDSPYAQAEKNAWLDHYLPEIPPERRLFPPCGTDKNAALRAGCGKQITCWMITRTTCNSGNRPPEASRF